MDGSGNPHLLYLWDDANTHTQYFVLRSRSGGTWSDVQTLSTIVNSSSYNNVKGDFQLLIDASNRFHIVYIRETSQGVRDLRYATNAPSGTWSDTAVVSGNAENLSSLTAGLDSNGKVHLACSFGALGRRGHPVPDERLRRVGRHQSGSERVRVLAGRTAPQVERRHCDQPRRIERHEGPGQAGNEPLVRRRVPGWSRCRVRRLLRRDLHE